MRKLCKVAWVAATATPLLQRHFLFQDPRRSCSPIRLVQVVWSCRLNPVADGLYRSE